MLGQPNPQTDPGCTAPSELQGLQIYAKQLTKYLTSIRKRLES